MKNALLLIGAGGHARSCIDVIEQEGRFAIGGLVGVASEAGSIVLGYRVIGTDGDIASFADLYTSAVVTVGQVKSADARIRLFEMLLASGLNAATIVSPQAYVSRHATIGEGTIVMHGAVVNAGARVGKNCILNSQSLIEHDAEIRDHCHISTSAVVNGGASVGVGTFVGSGAVVRESVHLGEKCVIGMGERVLADCPDGAKKPGSAKS